MQKKIKLSVLIPIYNSAQFLTDSINSILNQTFKDFELLLLDDCSTDGSFEFISQIKDKRVKVFRNDKNLGISTTRNKLIDLATGEYLAIMDNDDISLPTRFEHQIKFLDNNPDVSVVGTWTELFCKTKNKINPIKKLITNLGWIWTQPQTATIYDCLTASVVMHTSAMIRAKDLKQYNIKYKKEYTPAEDYKLWADILSSGLKIKNIPLILTKYNLHGSNFSILQKKRLKKSDKKIKEDIKSFLKIPNKKQKPYLFNIINKLRIKYFLRKHYD
ncbi:MAG: glycosyltransferase family 2 protein [Alphaproteobacteria bacterium]